LVLFAKNINLGQFLLTNVSAVSMTEKGFETILADAYEAVIAAVYFDGGLLAAKHFVLRQLQNALNNGYLGNSDHNFKSELLEISQSKGKGIPKYIMQKAEGPEHDRTFTVEVFLEHESYGVGTGKNKKEAEQRAAKNAVHQLQQGYKE